MSRLAAFTSGCHAKWMSGCLLVCGVVCAAWVLSSGHSKLEWVRGYEDCWWLLDFLLLDGLCKLDELLCRSRRDSRAAEGVGCQHLGSRFVPDFELVAASHQSSLREPLMMGSEALPELMVLWQVEAPCRRPKGMEMSRKNWSSQ